jgi:hypothetical protein
MSDPRHSKQTTADGIHTVIAYTYANAAARLAATGFDSSDIGKLAKQLDDGSFYILTTTAPTWAVFTLSAAAHAGLRQLIHLADDQGPFESFNTSMERVITGGLLYTSVVWYRDGAHTQKIVEKLVDRTNPTFPTQVQYKVYDVDGVTVLATATDTITYSGAEEIKRVRVIT